MISADEIIEALHMSPLEGEGGYYAETFWSDEMIPEVGLPDRYLGMRRIYTSIYYLLTPDQYSALHRLRTDDLFHFYLGDTVTMLQLRPDGSSETITLGHDVLHGQKLQVLVPRGTWQGSFLNDGGSFALMGTSMAPGFDEADYDLALVDDLLGLYPDKRDLILRLAPHI